MEAFVKICSRRRKKAEKAAEDSRTPKRWRAILGATSVRKVLECGCPLPLWLKRNTATNQKNIFAAHPPLLNSFNPFNLFNFPLRHCPSAPLR
jgi:hypothetical protein